MDNYRTVVIALILVSLLSFPARAQGIPGRWEKVEALKRGSPITVGLKNGDRLGGQFEELSPSELVLRTNSAQAAIPRADIKTITLPSKDGLGDGALTGAVTGAGLISVFALIAWAIGGGGGSSREIAVQMLALGGVGAGIGAVIGIAADAATKPDDIVLYKAPERP